MIRIKSGISKAMKYKPHLFTIILYIFFFLGFWKLPIAIYNESIEMDHFRYWYIRLFATVILLIHLYFRMWFEAVVLLVISLTLIFPYLLRPVVHSTRISKFFWPNFLVVSWGFSSIFKILAEKIEQKEMNKQAVLKTTLIIFLAQIFLNPYALLLFSGPR